MIKKDDLETFMDLYTCYEIAREDDNSSWVSSLVLISPFLPMGSLSLCVDKLLKLFRDIEDNTLPKGYYLARLISNSDEQTILAAVEAIKTDPVVNVPRIADFIQHGIDRDRGYRIQTTEYEKRRAHILTLLQGVSRNES